MSLTTQKPTLLKRITETKYTHIAIFFGIFALLTVIIFRNFIFSSEWPGGGDTLGWISRAYIFGRDFRWLYIWRPYSFGFPEGINSMDFFLMLTHSICKDAASTVKVFMIITFITASISMYAFAYHYNRCHISAFSASLIYCLNPWIFSQFTEGHVDIIFSYSLAPLTFLTLDRMLVRKNIKDALISALAIALVLTGFHPECTVVYGFFLITFTVFYLLSLLKNKKLTLNLKPLLKVLSIATIVCFLLCAFAVIPFIMGIRAQYFSTTFGYPIEDAMVSSYRNLTDAFTLRAVESWGYKSIINVYTDLSLPDFPINNLLLIIYGLAMCMILFRTDRYTLFFTFSVIISIFIAKGPYPPLGYIFTWMWSNIPYFDVFRAANRISMMTSLAHAFLVSVLVSGLTAKIQEKRRIKTEELYLKAKIQGKKVLISIDILNKTAKYIYNILYYLGILLLIFIFLSGFLSCTYFFSQGLQTYTPPKNYLEPYLWIANNPGDYKIITASRGPEEWEGIENPKSDFASSGMKTSLGWGHDIGYDSSFIHDKPTLQDGGWNPQARNFLNHLRFRLVRGYLTDNLFKILGPFNYKYLVLPEYLPDKTKKFFLNQHGYHIIYNQSSMVLQNNYYTPRFFAANQCLLVLGGPESFASLSKIENLKFNQTALLFIDQLKEFPQISNSISNNLEAFAFINSDITDAVMLSLKNKAIFMYAADYGFPSLNLTKYWASASSWTEVGAQVLGGNTLTTCGENSISIPFTLDKEEAYEIWIRIGFADYRGRLSISLDGNQIGEIQPTSHFWSGLKWIKINSLELKSGKHTITFKNDGKGYNDIDAVAIIKQGDFQSEMNHLLEIIKNFKGRILYILEAENTFTFSLPSNWQVALKPYEGYFLHLKNPAVNIAPQGTTSASSSGTWDITLLPNLANDGNLDTRWASKPHEPMPQWLTIEWNTPQEITGVRILFERAYAENYTVQTWNGTAWIDQVSVKGNNMLERMHIFKEPTRTSKIRILITAVTKLYDLVSIWELEAFTPPPPISKEIFTPREDLYVFALRLINDQNQGTPYLMIDQESIPLKQLNSTNNVQWYQSSPINLKAGNHIISIGTLNLYENICFDQLIVYSLKEGENISINDLFKAKNSPNLSYERINPYEYDVYIENNTTPFILVFSESYHTLWKAYLDGEEISPMPTYSLVNGFCINKTGSFHIKICFTGQTYVNIGLKISVATLTLVIIILLFPATKVNALKNLLAKMLKH